MEMLNTCEYLHTARARQKQCLFVFAFYLLASGWHGIGIRLEFISE